MADLHNNKNTISINVIFLKNYEPFKKFKTINLTPLYRGQSYNDTSNLTFELLC